MSNKSITPLIIETFIEEEDYFAGVFDKRPFTIIALLIAIIFSIILASSFLAIIWFDQIRSDLKQVIISRLFCSGCWICIFYLFLVYLPEMARYIFGPLPNFICFVQYFIKNAMTQQVLITLNMIFIF